MEDRVRRILTDLEAVREDLLALSDDIWLSIDHNDNEALEQSVEFKRNYNDRVAQFDRVATDLSTLVQQFTDVRVGDTAQVEPTEQDTEDTQRIIRELDRETPHNLTEDFEYTRPFGFVLGSRAVTELVTWRQMLKALCLVLADRDRTRFASLPQNPQFISTRGNRGFSRNPDELRQSMLIDDGIYAEVNLSANRIRDVMRSLLAEFGVAPEDLRIYLREDRDAGE